MKNSLNRNVIENPYESAFSNRNFRDYEIEKNNRKPNYKFVESIDELFNNLNIKDNMTISFHHHLRNGDKVLDMIVDKFIKLNVKGLTVASSSFFNCHKILVEAMKNKNVTKLHGSYYSGEVAKAISEGICEDVCEITTHGGRAREILEDELVIDIAFIAVPTVDKSGFGTGSVGKSSCGVLGYAYADAMKAKQVVYITDNVVDSIKDFELSNKWVDFILKVDSIGDPNGIVSGTTKITKDPVGLIVAKNCANLIEKSKLLKDDFSFQTGAGGISLAVASFIRDKMKNLNITGSFASGGITDYIVEMLEEGLFKELYDVQCFNAKAIKSIEEDENHHKMSANKYANINNRDNICSKLDVVVLGASEVDLDFNVNVTTGSDGYILGGSGGHADTAAGSELTIIVSKLFSSRRSVIVEKVKTITTPGSTVDAVVTDRGIAINPNNKDLLETLKNSDLDIVTIEELLDRARHFTGIPKVKNQNNEKVVAISKYRDGTQLNLIYKVNKNK